MAKQKTTKSTTNSDPWSEIYEAIEEEGKEGDTVTIAHDFSSRFDGSDDHPWWSEVYDDIDGFCVSCDQPRYVIQLDDGDCWKCGEPCIPMADERVPWWAKNRHGWCPHCHRHSYTADWTHGVCRDCETKMTAVDDPENRYGTGSDAPSRKVSSARDAWCPGCQQVVIETDSDDGKCWNCKAVLKPTQQSHRKEVRITMPHPDIMVSRDAHSYAMEVIQLCPGEVGGLGYVEKLDNGDLYIYEFALIEQQADSSHVEFNDEALHKFLADSSERDDHENLRVSWHSHGNMGAYFSSVDTDDAIAKWKEAGVPWLLSLIYNRKGEYKTRLDLFDSDAVDQVHLNDLTYMVERPAAVIEQAEKDVKELVHKPNSKWKKNSGGQEPPEKKTASTTRKNSTGATGGKAGSTRNNNGTGKSEKATEIQVVRGDDGPTHAQIGRMNKRARKRNRRELAARSDFTATEIHKMSEFEIAQCLWYLNKLDEGGDGVVRVGDDIPETFEGTKLEDLNLAEWRAFCKEQGLSTDVATRQLLLGKGDTA